MPIVSGPLTAEGAVVTVLVGISRRRRAKLQQLNRPACEPVQVRAQIDPGSGVTAFNPGVFSALAIPSIDTIAVRTPSTPRGQECHCPLYEVQISFVCNARVYTFRNIYAIAASGFSEGEAVEAILGRDVLAHCNFWYLGPERNFQLAF
jgi:hypothetical protein